MRVCAFLPQVCGHLGDGEKREKCRWGNSENMKDALSFPPQCELTLRKDESNRCSACKEQLVRDGRKKGGGGEPIGPVSGL